MSQPPPIPPPLPPRPIEYASRAPSNPPATAALIGGVLCLFFPVVPGIFAVLYGRRGIRRAAEVGVGAGMARAGLVLGVINLVLSVVAASILPFAILRARESAMRVACAANLRGLAQCTMLYLAENRGYTPTSMDQFVTNRYLSNGKLFVCPACANDAAKKPVAVLAAGPTHYHSLLPTSPVRLATIRRLATEVMLYEPLTNHNGKGANFVYWDGHVEWKEAVAAQALIAQLQARGPVVRSAPGQ